jgi:phenylalanyl-tRNA synthetase beta chain
MKISKHWLYEFVSTDMSSDNLASLLTFGGLEVESVDAIAPSFNNVIVAEIKNIDKHPQADRLNVCQVDSGADILQIVCGAPNVYVGMRVALALPGALLTDHEIKLSKIRGIESQGMLCSSRDLGLNEYESEGLLELPSDASIGVLLRDYLDLDDCILTIKPTPNRGDCLSLLGVAREVSALSKKPLIWNLPESVNPVLDESIGIIITAVKECPIYCARIIKGLNVNVDTPDWIKRKLIRSGIRSVSVVVDITNYVMLELGQPMHAFDRSKINNSIEVRFPKQNESLKLLNGETLHLSTNQLIIADAVGPLALAGIMGGEDSGVHSGTADIVLESAYFHRDCIAGKTRDLGFTSDAAYRFERGVDPLVVEIALERATYLIVQSCGGLVGPVNRSKSGEYEVRKVQLRIAKAERILGFPIHTDLVLETFSRLGFNPKLNQANIEVSVPSFRHDISIEEDLVEEFARVYGFDHIPITLAQSSAAMLPVSDDMTLLSTLRRRVASLDYQEVVTYSFVEKSWESDFCGNHAPFDLLNPISSHMSVMRSSLIGGLVNTLIYNISRKQTRIRLFEIGNCFLPHQESEQPSRLGMIAYGDIEPLQWGEKSRLCDFFDLKSDLVVLLNHQQFELKAIEYPAFHPGKSAQILLHEKPVGWMGELHPKWQNKYDLASPPVLIELDISVFSKSNPIQARELSKYPQVRRDLSAEFDDSVSYINIRRELINSGSKIVREVILFDLYRGDGIQKGKKSLAFNILMQDTSKTLTDAEVESTMTSLRQTLIDKFDAKLR